MSLYLSPASLQRIHIWRNEVHKSCPSVLTGQTITIPAPVLSSASSFVSTSGPLSPSASTTFLNSITNALQPAPPPDMHSFVDQPRRNSRWRRWLKLPPKPQHTNMYTDAAPAIPIPTNAPMDQFPDPEPSSADDDDNEHVIPSIAAPSATCSQLEDDHLDDTILNGTSDFVHKKGPIDTDDTEESYSDSSNGNGKNIRGSLMIEERQARLRSAQQLLIKEQQLVLEREQARQAAQDGVLVVAS